MSISKICIPNFVCVVRMKDTKHIRRDFHSVTLVMPQGWDFGALGVPRGGGQKYFFSNMVMWHIKSNYAPRVGLGVLGWGFAMAPHQLRILVSFLNDSWCVIFIFYF